MPITVDQVTALLNGLKIDFRPSPHSPNDLLIPVPTDCYLSTAGERVLWIVVAVASDGRHLELFTPQVLNTSDCKYKAALFGALLQSALFTRHIQTEHHPDSGEVRFACSVPVCDGTVTPEQVMCMLRDLVGFSEQLFPVFRHAMDTGKVDFGLAWKRPEPTTQANTPAAIPQEIRELIERAGGLERVDEIIKRLRAQGSPS